MTRSSHRSDEIRELLGALVGARLMLVIAMQHLSRSEERGVLERRFSELLALLQEHWDAPSPFQRGFMQALKGKVSDELPPESMPPFFRGLLAAGALTKKELEMRLEDGNPLIDLADCADANDLLDLAIGGAGPKTPWDDL